MRRKTIVRILIVAIILDLAILVPAIAHYQLSNWWSAKYDKETFNCVDMSYVLEEKFESLGIDAKVVYGVHREIGVNDSAHCWLLVNGWEFEATRLSFNKVSDYFTDYVIEEGKYLNGQKIYEHIFVERTL